MDDQTYAAARAYTDAHGGSGGANAVHYTADSGKTDAEKAQARTNLGLDELLQGKVDKPTTVKDTTTADVTVAAVKNTNYIYGELTDLTVTWGTGEDNAEISFIFKSGATPTTMLVSTTGAKFASFTPSANAIVEINAKWYLDAWIVLFHETAVGA